MSSNVITPMTNHYDQNRFETGIGPVTDRLLGTLLDKLTGGDFKDILTDKIVDPITEIINRKVKPYVYISIGLYIIVIILLALIIYLLIKKKNCKF
ncbi:hypothetical protein QJ856_gp0531 [Tupanvirus deep ocean]|uniref:Uncharacterized protein n=2 Tax=Tupanvirus TaxID=2094720 RepID=A0AC62A994_9VIRU|nr:hypothetical protein QJ856_gp0531 [Tupanvirus deep ocean]QKU34215.1 hypothetical protein [Tupanvirus deep ocean]